MPSPLPLYPVARGRALGLHRLADGSLFVMDDGAFARIEGGIARRRPELSEGFPKALQVWGLLGADENRMWLVTGQHSNIDHVLGLARIFQRHSGKWTQAIETHDIADITFRDGRLVGIGYEVAGPGQYDKPKLRVLAGNAGKPFAWPHVDACIAAWSILSRDETAVLAGCEHLALYRGSANHRLGREELPSPGCDGDLDTGMAEAGFEVLAADEILVWGTWSCAHDVHSSPYIARLGRGRAAIESAPPDDGLDLVRAAPDGTLFAITHQRRTKTAALWRRVDAGTWEHVDVGGTAIDVLPLGRDDVWIVTQNEGRSSLFHTSPVSDVLEL